MPHKSFVLIIVISPKCNTATPLTGFVVGASVGHTLYMGVCNTITGARIRSDAGGCGTLWRDQGAGLLALYDIGRILGHSATNVAEYREADDDQHAEQDR